MISCHRNGSDTRLLHIADMAESNPAEAVDSLRAIYAGTLSSADRHLYEFLSVKIPDKAYIRHTSDSLIMKVVEYESRHKGNGRYPEALYYAGRVYSDIGDYPQALHYFQNALESVGEDSNSLNLKANISSQYARVLTQLQLYSQAIPLIEISIDADRQLHNLQNEVYDLHLLGWTLMNADSIDKAEQVFAESFMKSDSLSPAIRAKSQMQLAEIKYKKGEVDSALMLIEGIPERVSSLSRNRAMSLAALIYLKASRTDTAYHYIKELLSSSDSNNKITGYALLLSPEIIKKVGNIDTIAGFVSEYQHMISLKYDDNARQLALLQQSKYNYGQHLLAKEKAQKKAQIIMYVSVCLIVLIFILAIIVLSQKNRNQRTIILLQVALEEARRLEKALMASTCEVKTPDPKDCQKPASDTDSETIGEQPQNDDSTTDTSGMKMQNLEPVLREEYRETLLTIYNNLKAPTKTPEAILASPICAKLKKMISDNEPLAKNSPLWDELEQEVLKCSPDFKTNLKLLAGGKFSSYDLHTALLIKCGLSNKDLAILFDRKKGTIASRRESLCKRVFDRQLGAPTIDGIIKLL